MRRLFPDVYACTSLPVTHRRRARAAAVLLLPGAVLRGRRAAVMWGVDLAERNATTPSSAPWPPAGEPARYAVSK
ncbi:hypothetical protein [Blastococcus colisei]|uniref:hypothetical protein n=1 Tax=Blastococcus colisei TaxID=1564162 RepID=UPI00115000BB|nr:hypothetical protein [Blastococcus colisei]